MKIKLSPLDLSFSRIGDNHSISRPQQSALGRFFRKGRYRKGACFLLAASLLILPMPRFSLAFDSLATAAREATSDVYTPLHRFGMMLERLFRKRQQPATLGDRLALVAGIRIFPSHFVAYTGEGASFSGLPTDSFSAVVQGAKLTWDTSDHSKMTIDEAGRATFLSPGLVWVTCQAGGASGRAPVLVRPGPRPTQSQADWNADQNSLSDSGSTSGGGMALLEKAFDSLAPTAYAQNGPSLDYLWNYVPNWIGTPRNAAISPSRIGPILPESNNVEAALPLVNTPGRGLSVNLTLYYNSRIWFRSGSTIYYDPLPSYPATGFSLGFGYIVTYLSSYPPYDTGYLYISPDGTPVYLGHGSATQSGTYATTNGSHIVYTGNASGGSLAFPNGSFMTMSLVNNYLLPTQVQNTNGDFETFAYMDSTQGYSPLALASTTDTLARVNTFNYDVNHRLISITTPAQGGGSTTLCSFNYGTHHFWYTFSGVFPSNAPTNNSTISVLSNVQQANGNGLVFTYSDYGMAYQIGILRGGTSQANANFNYPTSGTTSISDAPAFTSWTETPGGTYNITSSTNAGAKTITFTITRPDFSAGSLTRSTDTATVANGLLVQSEIKNSSGASMRKSVCTFSPDPSGGPQVTNVVVTDDAGNTARTAYAYNSGGFVTLKQEYGYSTSIQRQTNLSYVTAGGAFKPSEIDIYDETVNPAKEVSKKTYAYDNYAALGGMQDYGGTANPPGHLSSYNATVTNRGNLTGETDWYDIANNLSITRLAQIDIFGNTVKAQLSCCNTQTATLDQSNYWSNATGITKGSPGGPQLTMTYTYDFNTSITTGKSDPNGLTQSYQYDQYLRPTVIGLPTGATATANWGDSTMQATSGMTYIDGGTIKTVSQTTYMDAWGEVIETLDAAGDQVNTSYDAMGRMESRTNPFLHGTTPGPSTVYQYDALGRATLETFPDGSTIEFAYTGNTTTVTDQVGRVTQSQFDGLGRLVTLTEQNPATGGLTQTTTYTYNCLDKLTQVNQSGQLRAWSYDGLGRIAYERIPEQTATINDGVGGMWTSKFAYTDFGAVSTKTDARGVVVSYGYDSMNRLTSISYDTSHASGVAPTPNVTWTYDNSTTSVTQGLLLSVNVGGFYSESYSYDNFEQISSTTDVISGKSYTTRYLRNQAGELTQLTYPSTRVLPYVYDSVGRLCSIGGTSGGNGGACANGYMNSISYNPAGQITGFTLGNGVAETLTYDPDLLEPTGLQAIKGSSSLLNLTYGYSATAGEMGLGTTAGNTGQLISVTGTINGQSESNSYSYDLNRRLVSASETSNGQSAGRSYTWDALGNRLTETDTIAQAQVQSLTLQQSAGVTTNRVTTLNNSGLNFNYTYDNNGNVLSDGTGNTYTYDAENRLVSVSGAVSIQNSYDFQNRRVINTENGTTTHYIWQDGRVLAEMNGASGSPSIDYILGGGSFIAKIQADGTASYFIGDGRSKRLRLDSTGTVQGVMGTLPFGEDFAESGTQEKHHFTTYDRDSTTGLDYGVNRQYGSNTGRFYSPDPDPGSARTANPQSWNRYAYVVGDPVNRQDALGLDGFLPGGTDWGNIQQWRVWNIIWAALGGAFDPGRHPELLDTGDGPGGGGGDPGPVNTPTCRREGVSNYKGGSIDPSIPLTFPGNVRTYGPSTIGHFGPGEYWNTLIAFSVSDDVANWTVQQSADAVYRGDIQLPDGTVKKDQTISVHAGPDDEIISDHQKVQIPGQKWLFWEDDPGLWYHLWRPINGTFDASLKSWIFEGNVKCEMSWSVHLVWKDGQFDDADSTATGAPPDHIGSM